MSAWEELQKCVLCNTKGRRYEKHSLLLTHPLFHSVDLAFAFVVLDSGIVIVSLNSTKWFAVLQDVREEASDVSPQIYARECQPLSARFQCELHKAQESGPLLQLLSPDPAVSSWRLPHSLSAPPSPPTASLVCTNEDTSAHH